jgi:hypothetical protein
MPAQGVTPAGDIKPAREGVLRVRRLRRVSQSLSTTSCCSGAHRTRNQRIVELMFDDLALGSPIVA